MIGCENNGLNGLSKPLVIDGTNERKRKPLEKLHLQPNLEPRKKMSAEEETVRLRCILLSVVPTAVYICACVMPWGWRVGGSSVTLPVPHEDGGDAC